MSEPLCPVTPDGRHKRKPWHDKERNLSGLACVKCHRTWVFQGEELIPWWDLKT